MYFLNEEVLNTQNSLVCVQLWSGASQKALEVHWFLLSRKSFVIFSTTHCETMQISLSLSTCQMHSGDISLQSLQAEIGILMTNCRKQRMYFGQLLLQETFTKRSSQLASYKIFPHAIWCQ